MVRASQFDSRLSSNQSAVTSYENIISILAFAASRMIPVPENSCYCLLMMGYPFR